MNKVIERELNKIGVQFNKDDTHIFIEKKSELSTNKIKENECYLIEYNNNQYKIEVIKKYNDGVQVNGILVKDNQEIFSENIYKKLLFEEFKVLQKE